jgi:hypothetical protein
MTQLKSDRRPRYQPALTRFARILLTLGTGESPWLIVAFVLGVVAVGVLSNFVFSVTFDPATFVMDRTARTLIVVGAFVLLAYAAYCYDLRQAWRTRKITATFDERRRAKPHAGLIWLLSPRDIEAPLFAIRYHHVEGSAVLQHCWVLISPGATAAYDRLAARVEEVGYKVELHPVALSGETIEATYQAIDHIYGAEAERAGLQADQIIADLTGGLKTMTAGMVMACLPHGRQLEYIESDRDAQGEVIKDSQRAIKVGVDFALRR